MSTSAQWVYRKMLLGDWLIYQPNTDDPDDITHVVDLGEVSNERQAAAIVAALNGPSTPQPLDEPPDEAFSAPLAEADKCPF